ncbi:hypothetical protein WJX82_010026 [Trebouxia sp. C0006]
MNRAMLPVVVDVSTLGPIQLSLRRTFDQLPKARSILAEFCQAYSLDPARCQLYNLDRTVAHHVTVEQGANIVFLKKATVSTPDKQEHQLAVHAVELVIPLLKHYVRQREGVASTVTLFQFLECVLDKEPNSTVQALLAQLLASGGMAVLVTMLDACPDASPLVCTTLLRLTAFQDQLSDQEVAANRSLFARMRGIPRLSCMLLPPFHPDDTAQIALAAKVYTKVPSELLPPDSYYLPSVEYMKDIVAEFPLSAHTPEAATLNSSAPSTHSFFNMTSISTTDFVVWPHLTPAAWKDIQTVALRAFVTLEWFGDTKVQARLDQRGKGPKSLVYQVYRQELIVLVHQPLVGHIMDPHLDMQQIARFGLGPTLRMLREAPICYAQIQQQLYELGRVLLERLRSDSTLVTHGTDVLEKKWDFARENAASLYVGMLAGDAINLRQPKPFGAAIMERSALEVVLNSIQQAVEVPLPWSTELCVALTRALWRIFDLFLAWGHSPVIKHGPGLQGPIVKLLGHLHLTTSNVSLQRQMLISAGNCQQILMAAPSACTLTHSDGWLLRVPQGLSKLMTDLVARYWQEDGKGDPSAYCHIGLPDMRMAVLGKHAVPLVLHSWVKSANYWMKHKHAGSQKDIVITKMQMHIPALACYGRTRATGDTAPYPGDAAFALMQTNFICLWRLGDVHRELAQTMDMLDHCHALRDKAIAAKAKESLNQVQSLMDTVKNAITISLPGLRGIREDPKWRAAIAEQQGRFFALDTAASLRSHIDYVKGNSIIPAQALPDIVWCFPSLKGRVMKSQAADFSDVRADNNPLHAERAAAAEAAAQHLLGEEEKEAAKAAAKKSKKQKQKVKKQARQQQQQQQEEKEEEEEASTAMPEDAGSPTTSDHEQQSSGLGAAVTAGDGMAAEADGIPATPDASSQTLSGPDRHNYHHNTLVSDPEAVFETDGGACDCC